MHYAPKRALIDVAIAALWLVVQSNPATADPVRTTIQPIPDMVWQNMIGRSWKEQAEGCSGPDCKCPARGDLKLLLVPHVDFAGQIQLGKLIVHASVAPKIAAALDMLLARRFPIEKMRLIDEYEADDDRSMNDNNTSAFNCRVKTNGVELSKHSSGLAIDINPIQNPYVRGNTVLPPAGREFALPKARNSAVKGLIAARGSAVTAFLRIGWKWGGSWGNYKDYQHFSDDGT